MPVTGNGRYGSSRVLVVLVGSGMVPGVGMDPGEYCTWGFCNLTVNSGMRIGPVRGLSARR